MDTDVTAVCSRLGPGVFTGHALGKYACVRDTAGNLLYTALILEPLKRRGARRTGDQSMLTTSG